MKSLKNSFLGLLLLVTSLVSAQHHLKHNIEYSGFFDSYYYRGPIAFTGGLGSAIYGGDLCGGFGCAKFRPSLTLGGYYKLWPRVAFGADLGIIGLGSKDKESTRNFTYKGTNIELMAYGRFYLMDEVVRRQPDLIKKKITVKPFVSLGLGTVLFFPKTVDASGQKVDEDVNLPMTLAIPIGLGLDYRISNRISISPEITFKYTFSDNIDDVGEIYGSNKAKDSYTHFNIKVIYSPFAPRQKPKKMSKHDAEILNRNLNEMNQSNDSTRAKNDSTAKDDEDLKNDPNVKYEDDNDLLQTTDPNAPTDEIPTETDPNSDINKDEENAGW